MKINHQTFRGFTLIEIMVSVVIVGFILIGLTRFSQLFLSGYEFSFQETQAISEAQRAITVMEREIREMRDGVEGAYPLSVANDNEIVFYSDVDDDGLVERVRYYIVGSDLVKQVFEYVIGVTNYACVNGCTICHDGSNDITIPETSWPAHKTHGDYLGVCGGGGEVYSGGIDDYEQIVASYIVQGTNPLFTYYNGQWPVDTVNNPLPVDQRLLSTRLIEISVSVNIDPGSNPDDFTASTAIQLRNLKDNL